MVASFPLRVFTWWYFVAVPSVDLVTRKIHRHPHPRPKDTKIALYFLTKCNFSGTIPGLTLRQSNQAMGPASKPKRNKLLLLRTKKRNDDASLITNETRWFFLSVLNTANVLPLTLGYHRPLALMIVRICWLSAFIWLSKTRVEPHLATWANPFEAWPPYSQTLQRINQKLLDYTSIKYFLWSYF